METPKDFNELVTWATWEIVQGITSGKPLRSVVFGVLSASIQIMNEWKTKSNVC